MNLKSIPQSLFFLTLSCVLMASQAVMADTTNARCDIYKKGSDYGDAPIACIFSQRQGYITITRSDNKVHELKPDATIAGQYTDENGNDVYRDMDLGDRGLIFRFKKISIYIYWDTYGIPETDKQTTASPTNQTQGGYDQQFSLDGISFQVSCPNDSSLNTLMIKPSGFEIDNSVIKKEIDGTVTSAEAADVNNDGSPEIYVYITSAGSGSYGDVVAYSSNNNKSMSPIYLPPLSDDKVNSVGYMGHDEFSVVETSLARRFPIYKKGDTNSKPTGGTRQLQYKLVQGEASWQLKMIRAIEY